MKFLFLNFVLLQDYHLLGHYPFLLYLWAHYYHVHKGLSICRLTKISVAKLVFVPIFGLTFVVQEMG